MIKPIDIWLKKYEARTAVAVDDYKWGVKNPKRPPATTAIEFRDVLEKKMAAKETWDKWEDALKFIGDEGVIEAALEKGAGRYVPGVRFGLPKVKSFAEAFSPHLAEGVKKALAIKKVTLEDAIERAATIIRHNAEFRYKKG